ncbi:MAG: prealbumin-like fold domain-containing protein [Coriobacteriaceae bacterium]|nr:prealbumin-like fold domain-containing protein [Coriobacteriaceae bacterium]
MPVLLVIAMVVCVSACLPAQAYAAGKGSLQIKNTSGADATYLVVPIADADALPLEENFAWVDVAGQKVGDNDPFPSYDPNASNAKAQGRALVEAVSRAVTKDENGSLAHWLSGYVAADAEGTCDQLVSGGDALSVDDGWYLLVAKDRRPLLAWVEGDPVVLWDKSSTPVLTMDVKTDEDWSESAVYGAGKTLSYRMTMTVPDTYSLFTTYACAMHAEWNPLLSLREGSVHVELNTTSRKAVDLTDFATVEAGESAMDIRFADLCQTEAKPGDSIVVTYELDADAVTGSGAAGLLNTAWATFPSFDGEGRTPSVSVKAYTSKMYVRAATRNGKTLEGATFALRGADGKWLTSDGRFAGESERGLWKTDASGKVEIAPVLGCGVYTLVETKAPAGYELAAGSESTVKLTAEHSIENFTLTCSTSGAAKVDEVDAQDASVTLLVEHDKKKEPPSDPLDIIGKLPQTWDSLAPFTKFGFIALALGLAAVALGHFLKKDGATDGGSES